METRAPYVLIGSFVLAAILAVFGFVYWLNNTGGIGPRTSYHVQFQGPVPGLLVGAGVLFNGIRASARSPSSGLRRTIHASSMRRYRLLQPRRCAPTAGSGSISRG
ncbi:hypothetical protein ACVWWO_002374 [Bradyrhizobium sp. F1.13.1]